MPFDAALACGADAGALCCRGPLSASKDGGLPGERVTGAAGQSSGEGASNLNLKFGGRASDRTKKGTLVFGATILMGEHVLGR